MIWCCGGHSSRKAWHDSVSARTGWPLSIIIIIIMMIIMIIIIIIIIIIIAFKGRKCFIIIIIIAFKVRKCLIIIRRRIIRI